mgnify:CR=1 FL=1
MTGGFKLSFHAANANSQGTVFKINMPPSLLLWWIVNMLRVWRLKGCLVRVRWAFSPFQSPPPDLGSYSLQFSLVFEPGILTRHVQIQLSVSNCWFWQTENSHWVIGSAAMWSLACKPPCAPLLEDLVLFISKPFQVIHTRIIYNLIFSFHLAKLSA